MHSTTHSYLYSTKHLAMDIALKKLDLMQRLMLIWDEAALQRVAKVIEKEVPADIDAEEDITEQEFAAFQQELSKRDQGDIRFYSEEESIRMIREGFQE